MSAISLHYYDGWGRAEVARMILHYNGTQFTDNRIPFGEWPALRQSGFSEFNEIPALDIDGLRLVQSRSISRYLCNKFGYVASNNYEEYLVESICELKEDMFQHFFNLVVKKDVEGIDRDMNNEAPAWLKLFEARLEKNNKGAGWIVGNRVTRADFDLFELLADYMMKGNKYESILAASAPKLRAWFDRFRNSSATFKSYYDNRGIAPF